MKYLFELSKDHNYISSSEVLSCLNAEEINYIIREKNRDVLIIETNDKNDFSTVANRLSNTFFIDTFLFSSKTKLNIIKNEAEKNQIIKQGSISIRYKNRSKNINSQDIVKILASIYTKNRIVDLNNPNIELRFIITDSKVYVGTKLFKINRTQFEERKVQNRPFFSPISLHPRLARSLVNISCIKKDEELLDPFCGTGGILLEAGLIGVKVIGNDIEEKMIQGSKETLDFYKLKNYKLFSSDIGDIKNHVDFVDSIVTDLPYGKATTTKGEDIEKLYMRTFEVFTEILKEKKKAVVGLSDKKWVKTYKHLKLKDIYKFRSHKSLTRYFVVFEKQP